MTKTLNPTITITVSGPTGSGKSRVLAAIAGMLSLTCSNCTIETPDVEAEMKYGNNYLNWPKARSGTIFKLEETNQPINTGRCIATPITIEDLFDRPTPVHIQKLMDKLGVFIEGPEYQEADLQPVVDLVNWALTMPKIPESIPQPDAKNGAQATSADKENVIRDILNGAIAVLDCQKKQQAHRQKLTEEIRQELLNIIHNRLG
ncbi:hypothetical protein G3755_004055 [Salmonella enterica]|nr:hypothetical protein [Salmonella enterica subsp. enterica serovar Hvittingfoss]EEK9101876.1 hypothetical protein [Salmonella enterica]EEP0416531.1 hypothetical protein [Salmonella enterica]EFB0170384.1 hypothetical protein [Salmonella enterica]EFO6663454.1 hypothetical protein [Salmonella enterica]